MTEDDAKTKWCPMCRFANLDNVGPVSNRETFFRGAPNPDTCIASDCMMWQQTDNECEPQQHPKDSSAAMPEPKCYPAGYCGLAGK